MIFVIIRDYFKAKLRVGPVEEVFSVAGHEIICMLITHPPLLNVERPALSVGKRSVFPSSLTVRGIT